MKKKENDCQPLKKKKIIGNNQSIYVYDKETDQWKVYNPGGSKAYNCLSRDEWGWLD